MSEKDLTVNKKTSSRLFEVDVIKAFAILWMVLVHAYEYMGNIVYLTVMPEDFFRNFIEFAGGPLAAPVFMFAMGIGMVYTRHDSPGEFAKRGIKLIIGGYVLNFFRITSLYMLADALEIEKNTVFTTFESFFIVDVLHLAGLSFLLVALLKVIKVKAIPTLCLALVMLVIGGFFTTSIGTRTLAENTAISDLILGLFIFSGKTTAFPLLLWFVYPASGMVFGEILQKTEDRASLYKKLLAGSVIVCGLVSVIYTWIGQDVRYFHTLAYEKYYMNDLYHYVFTISVVLIALTLAFFIFRRAQDTGFGRFITYCSVNLNTIYVCQWLLISGTLTVMAFAELENVGPAGIVIAGIIITAVATGLSYVWKMIRNKIRKMSTSTYEI